MHGLSRGLTSDGYAAASTEGRSALIGRVLGLLGFAFLFTAGGALLGLGLGPGGLLLSIVGSFATLIGLLFARERSPLNLILLYAFATFEGMLLGPLLDAYVAQGLGAVVVNAALSTAGVSLAAGAYGATTRRDLGRLGGILGVALLGIVIASLVGLFIQSSGLQIAISAIAVVVFTGLLAVDLNRAANSPAATRGQTILVAVNVYLDVLNLFTALLRIFGAAGNRSRD